MGFISGLINYNFIYRLIDYRKIHLFILSQKIPKQFCCETCDYICSNKKDYSKHLSTRKHQNGSKMIVNGIGLSLCPTMSTSSKLYTCECGKTYKWDSGYYRHRKTCSIPLVDNHNTNIA